MKLVRKILLFKTKSGEIYRLRFGAKALTYQRFTDRGSGPPRTVFYDTVEIAPKEQFISWLNTNNETVRMIANLNNRSINYNYASKGIRHFSRGKILYFGLPANASERRIQKVLKRIFLRKETNGI